MGNLDKINSCIYCVLKGECMNNFKYDVTVVVPVYNSQDYIEECVLSIQNQTLNSARIETLLINDGSVDGSGEICERLSKQFKEVKYIYKENSGVSDTRNVGIKQALGKYIMLLDSDDYLSEETIENLVRFFDNHYNEIDLVTYPIYWDRNGKKSLHNRYSEKKYDKGTGIYDLEEYPYLNQSTVNIIFKNEFEKNNLYDVSMKLSEDQNFNTCMLMRKNKIGFVQEAIYYYRRYGGGVSQTRNNPYYCFDDIMSYNESLLTRFTLNGKTPKYVQTLIINTFAWRVKSDQLLPYYLEGQEFEKAKERIFNILKCIDDEVIIKYADCDEYIKLYFLKNKGTDLEYAIKEDSFNIWTKNGTEFCSDEKVKIYLYKNRIHKNIITMFASFASPLLELCPIQQYCIEGKLKDGTKFGGNFDIKASKLPFRNSKMKTASEYPFTFSFDAEEVKSFSIYVFVDGKKIAVNPVYIKYSGFIERFKRRAIPLGEYWLKNNENTFNVSKANIFKELTKEMGSMIHYPKKQLLGILSYRHLAKMNKRTIWLYYDSPGVIDNGYYQFIHDFEKNDGIERYYVVDGDTAFLENKLTDEQKKYLVKHKSKQHKILFLQSKKIFVSFCSFSIYSPFGNLSWYMDLLQYELIYLQHGILHASLQTMYGKEYTEIDKFIISSEFEKNNLIENYDYSPEDLLMSGMPRMAQKEESVQVKNKILFAPSWRQYLIGQLVDNKRVLLDEQFLNSDYFKEINTFLHSKELQKLLEENDLELDFKLHPIFKQYKKHFEVENVPRVDINFEKTILGEYKIFITDFSSYQFDYVKLVRPIVYFLPDPVEMRAGIHSYRSLDLKYEDAFGELCLTSEKLLEQLEDIINNGFNVREPFKSRMENFFNIDSDPCEKIYQEMIKN